MEDCIKKVIADSKNKIDALKKDVDSVYFDGRYNNIIIYVCGSLARQEMVDTSDLDLFFIALNDQMVSSNIDKYNFFSLMYDINKKNGFKEPSKNGYYWRFTPKENLLDIGSQEEDYNNSFTARMLLILESKPLWNNDEYDNLLSIVVGKYFEEFDSHSDNFYPLFLMNDILRYWYTLTINYEYRRDPSDDKNKRYWKRLKLKYARLLTCFSFVACLCSGPTNQHDVIEFVHYTPFERLDYLANRFSDLKDVISHIKNEYTYYIELHYKDRDWLEYDENKKQAFERADLFHSLLIHDFLRNIVEKNPTIKNKIDMF